MSELNNITDNFSPEELQLLKADKPDIYKEYIFPSLSKRIQALFIDFIIILLVFWGSSYLFTYFKDIDPIIRAAIFIFMLFLYEPTLIHFFKGTIGHQITNLKVSKFDNPELRISFVSALFRFIIKWFLGWLSFISIFFNDNNRAVHDIVSNSVVTFFEVDKNDK